MGNEVSTVFGGKVAVKDLKSLASRAAESAANSKLGGAPDGSEYMNFSGKQGRCFYGQGDDVEEVQSDERWLVNVTSFEEGWVCWKGGKPAANRLANIFTGVPVPTPDFEEFGPFDSQRGEGWSRAKAMVMRSVDYADRQGYFKINSISGCSEMAKLMEAFAGRAENDEPSWPVVRIVPEKFESQGFTNYKPVFVVEGWLTTEQLDELAEGADIDTLLGSDPVDEAEDEDEEEEQPKKAAAKPKAGSKPAGRTRRRS